MAKLFTQSAETFEVELYGVDPLNIASLELGLFPQAVSNNGDSNAQAQAIIKTLTDGITLVDSTAFVSLSDSDITQKGCYFVEMRFTDLSGNESNLDIRPDKVTFKHARLA